MSSVLDVSLREGNTQNIKGSATIGLLASRIFLEGPIIKERTSFLISLRRSFWDFFANPIQRISQNPEVLSYNFFDVTLKINHQLNPTNVISASFYTGKDRFSTQVDESVTIDNQNFRLEEKYTLGWGNRIAMLRWTSGKANPWLSKLTLYNTIYRFDISDQLRQNSNGTIRKFFLSFQSDIQNWTIAEDLQFSITHNHTLRLGANAGMYLFTPGAFILEQDNDSTATEDRNASGFRIQTYEWNTYLEDELGLGKKIQINAGLRLNGFISGDKQVIIPQPRVSVNFDINAKTSLRGSFSRMGQFIHVLSNSTVSMPLDLWVPSTPNIGPQSGWELSAGIFRNESKYWELTLEAYYKQLKGMVEYQEGANMFMDGVSTQLANTPLWEQKVVTGKGWSYGIEGLLRKKEGRFDGWLSYSLAWHRRQFTLLNNGEPFPYKYDRRHDFDLVFHYLWKPNISFDLTWSYQSGQTGNLPVGGYAAHPWIDGFAFDDFIVFYGSRNSYRFKPYHRLDVGITLKKSRWGGTQSWKLGVYNLYNRANPFAVSVYGRPGTASVIESSLFPILPIVSYQWAF
ncbi:MAG: TonB-dependent receptor [Bacteroidia bacterium]